MNKIKIIKFLFSAFLLLNLPAFAQVEDSLSSGEAPSKRPKYMENSELYVSDERVFIKKKKKQTVEIAGKIYKRSGERLNGAYVSIKEGKNGKVVAETFAGDNGYFKVVLPLDKHYFVSVSYGGFYTKNIDLSARVFDQGLYDRWSVKFNVEMIDTFALVKELPELQKPVAKIIYYGERYGFGYDENYTRKAHEEITKRVQEETIKLASGGNKEIEEKLINAEALKVKAEKAGALADIPAVEEKMSEFRNGVTDEIIFETRRTIKRTIIKDKSRNDVYQQVNYPWGGVFYFKNNQNITEASYSAELAPFKKPIPVSQ